MHMLDHSAIIVDSDVLRTAMADRGYSSITQLAASLGLHRNTVGSYFAEERALPEALEKIILALDLSPGEALRRVPDKRSIPGLTISCLVDEILQIKPTCALVLFGSRARGTHKPLSDYDLGVFCNSGLRFREYSTMLSKVDRWNQTKMTTVQLANLSEADDDFLVSIREDLLFLGGSMSQWRNLLTKAGLQVNE